MTQCVWDNAGLWPYPFSSNALQAYNQSITAFNKAMALHQGWTMTNFSAPFNNGSASVSMPGFLVTPDPTKKLPLMLYIGGTDYPKEVHLCHCFCPAHVTFRSLAAEHACIHAFFGLLSEHAYLLLEAGSEVPFLRCCLMAMGLEAARTKPLPFCDCSISDTIHDMDISSLPSCCSFPSFSLHMCCSLTLQQHHLVETCMSVV